METIDKEWMDETCGTCVFRDIQGRCRRRPPVVELPLTNQIKNTADYKMYSTTGGYIKVHRELPACYDWRRR